MRNSLIALGLALCLAWGTASAEKKETPQLVFFCWGTAESQAATQLALDRYGKEITKSRATQMAVATREEYEAKLREGVMADVLQLDMEMLRTLGLDAQGNHRFADMEILRRTIALNDFGYFGLAAGTMNGRLCAVPASMSAHLLFWNSGELLRRDVLVPTSAEELGAAARRLSQEAGMYPLAADATGRMAMVVTYLQSRYGDQWLDTDTLTCKFGEAQVAEGLVYLQNLEKTGVLPPLSQQGDLLTGWREGRYLGIWAWDSLTSALVAALPEGTTIETSASLADWGPYPGGFQKATMMFAVSEKSQHPEEAARLINYILGSVWGARALRGLYGVPDNVKGFSANQQFRLLDKQLVAANQVALSWGRYSMPLGFEAPALAGENGLYTQVLLELEKGVLTPEAAAQALRSGVEAVLKAK